MYAVRKSLKLWSKGVGCPCACVLVRLCAGDRQFLVSLLRGPSISFLMEPRRGTRILAGFQGIELFIGPPSSFCVKGLEAPGVLQRGMNNDPVPFPTVPCLQSCRFPLLPLLHQGRRVRTGTASLGPRLHWAKLALQCCCRLTSFQFKAVWASQSLLEV